jgi:hypothetical protein
MTTRMLRFSALLSVCLAGMLTASAQDASPTYKAKVPDSIRTPNNVETKTLGTLRFFDGMPSAETVAKTYDYLDVARAAEAFLAGVPATSAYSVMEGFKEVGMQAGDLGLAEELLDARSLFLTPNTTTVYAILEFDLKDGPFVMEIPPGVLGPVQDAFFRFVVDFGPVGPDQGKGGKYVFAHQSYKGALPQGAFEVRSRTYRNMAFFRVFVKDGDLAAAARSVKSSFRCYPLAQAQNPPQQKFVNVSGKRFNTIHSNDFKFFEELNAVIQYEPADAHDPEPLGLFASIGIKKGQPFAPDERMKRLLTEGVAIGNAAARSISFANRDRSVYYYPDRQWFASFAGTYDFIDNGALDSDKRVLWLYNATGVTPAMSTPKGGHGFGLSDGRSRLEGAISRRRQHLFGHASHADSGQQFLGVHRLRRPDAEPSGNGPEACRPRQQRQEREGQQRRLLHGLFWPEGSSGKGRQLGADRAGQELLRVPPLVRPA